MIKNRHIIFTFVCLMLLSGFRRAGANIIFFSKDSVSSDLNERVCLLTDRNLYIAGEKIWFSAFIISSPFSGEYDLSKVLFLELISPNGEPVFQAKYPITEFKANGFLQLPGNIFTGNYFLKAYTRWMRNFLLSDYAWVKIKVINPFQIEVEGSDEFDDDGEEENFIPADRNFRNNEIYCQTDKTRYDRRDRVMLRLAIPPGLNNAPEYYCVTVIRPGVIDTMYYDMNLSSHERKHRNFPLKYVADIRGLSLSGMVVEESTGFGVSQAHVRLSVLGEKSDYLSYLTRDDGSFLFALEPFNGTADMYIAVEPEKDKSLEILVDKEYASDNPAMFKQTFKLSEKEKETATELMLHYQIEKAYCENFQDTSAGSDNKIKDFFYSQPSSTIYIDDYIRLPTIGESIFELVPDVAVIKRNDQYYLRSRSYISDLEVYSPLILIDNIPVSNIGAMLEMSPEKIERIDVVDRIYAKGDLLFGGILSLISRKGDMAGIDLPENSYFFSFDGFVQTDSIKFPGTENQIFDSRIPDVRNCLYWNPSIRIVPGDTTEIEFYTSDIAGPYTVVVRGITEKGIVVEGDVVFHVAGSENPDSNNE